MMTPAEIEAQLRAAYPDLFTQEGGQRRKLSTADYEARIAEMVQAEIARESAEVVAAARADLRRKARLALAMLDQPVTATNVVQRVTQTRVIVRELIEYLVPNEGGS